MVVQPKLLLFLLTLSFSFGSPSVQATRLMTRVFGNVDSQPPPPVRLRNPGQYNEVHDAAQNYWRGLDPTQAEHLLPASLITKNAATALLLDFVNRPLLPKFTEDGGLL